MKAETLTPEITAASTDSQTHEQQTHQQIALCSFQHYPVTLEWIETFTRAVDLSQVGEHAGLSVDGVILTTSHEFGEGDVHPVVACIRAHMRLYHVKIRHLSNDEKIRIHKL